MTIDSNDKLWIAIGESGHVAQYDPETGKELQRVKLPVQRPTSLEFGGEFPDNEFLVSPIKLLTPKLRRFWTVLWFSLGREFLILGIG
jgi:hypothetical protein